MGTPFFIFSTKCVKIKKITTQYLYMKFKVYYSIEKDIWNHLNANWKFGYPRYGRKSIQEKLLKPFPKEYKDNLAKAKTREAAVEVIKDYFVARSKSFNNLMPIVAKGVETLLNDGKTKIIDKLEKVYNKSFPFEKVTVYLTTAFIHPYNYEEGWFMTGYFSDMTRHISTATHELNHFMFYYYYPHLKDKIGNEKYEILKEALAIYTNPEGTDKPTVKKLEQYFKKHLDKTIDEIIEKGEWAKYF